MSDDKVYVPRKSISQKNTYSPSQLHEMICKMTPAQLNWLIFYLKMPKLLIPSPTDSMEHKANIIVNYAENTPGFGIEKLSAAIQKASTNVPIESSSGSGRLIGVLVALLAVGGAGYYFMIKPDTTATPKDPPAQIDAFATINTNTKKEPELKEPESTKTADKVIEPLTQPSPAIAAKTEPEKIVNSVEEPAELPKVEEPKPIQPKVDSSFTLFFASSSTKITEEHHASLDKIVEILKTHKDTKILIEGHADPEGNERRNKRLSIERANEAKRYLKSKGVSGSQLEVIGCGDSVPFGDVNTEDGRNKSRRVVFSIITEQSDKCK